MSVNQSSVFTGSNSLKQFSKFLSGNSFSQLFMLVDENTFQYCYPLVKGTLPQHVVIQIKSGEKNKTLKTCEQVWKKLTEYNADRNTLLINLGGGVIGDLGGFAAGCYKRGIKFINLPTTLLAMIDASVGAKTGIDFNGYKNQIGLFNDPQAVFIHTVFLETLPHAELRSGFAEVIKHYLIADKKAFRSLTGKSDVLHTVDWNALVKKNVAIKSKIVLADKFEVGDRKALNFGHTIGHAVESYFLAKKIPVLHGEAVAVGIICESLISELCGKLSRAEYLQILRVMGAVFPDLPALEKKAIPTVLKLMQQDKKNTLGKINFTLLQGIGNFSINNFVEEDMIIHSLEYYSEIAS
ncbi:MAG TPA: 3-dehydroquinate synthase [Chitinophagales bacterium]|nr:3-dehydroquinate synthase [Chitinophagales bacterium]